MTTILTTNKLKEITAISNAVDVNNLLPFISIAELFHVKPILGDELFEEIVLGIEDNNLSADLTKLVNTYVIPTSAFYTWYEAAPHLWLKTEAKGVVKKFSDNSSSIEGNDFKIYRQSIYDKAIHYSNLLRKEVQKKDECRVKTANQTGFFLNFR